MATINIDIEVDGLNYNNHGLNCNIVPIYLATKAYNECNPLIFYTYFYFHFHYNISNFSWNLNHDEDSLTNYVLKNKLGLELKKVEVNNQLIRRITEGIDKGFPVIVPNNSGLYFYNSKYKKKDHRHMLLVKGYDKEKKILIIHDNDHLGQLLKEPKFLKELGSVYTTFTMKYTDCKMYFESYNTIFNVNNNEIQYLVPIGEQRIKSFKEAIADISKSVRVYNDHFDLFKNKMNIIENLISNKQYDQKLVSLVNTHYIIHKMTINYIKSSGIQTEKVFQDLSRLSLKVYEAWKDYLIKGLVMRERENFNINLLNNFKELIISNELKYLGFLEKIEDYHQQE